MGRGDLGDISITMNADRKSLLERLGSELQKKGTN